MSAIIRKVFLLTTLLCIALVLSSCASVQDYTDFVADYENSYRAQHPYEVHTVVRDGLAIHVREFGAKNPGTPIILMHGFPDSLHLYDRVIPLLADSRHVIAFDFIGWGNSSKPSQHVYDTSSLLHDLEAVIAYFRFQSVILVGHDASGFPAIDWSLDHAERTEALVLLNTVYSPMESVVPPEAIALFSTPSLLRTVRRWGAYRSDALWQSGLIEQTSKFYSDPAVRDVYVKIFAHQALTIRPAFFGLNEVLRDEVARRQVEVPRMQLFKQPVVIIFGGDDPYLNTQVAKEFDATFPNSHLNIVKNAGHYVQLDQPAQVSTLLLEAIGL